MELIENAEIELELETGEKVFFPDPGLQGLLELMELRETAIVDAAPQVIAKISRVEGFKVNGVELDGEQFKQFNLPIPLAFQIFWGYIKLLNSAMAQDAAKAGSSEKNEGSQTV